MPTITGEDVYLVSCGTRLGEWPKVVTVRDPHSGQLTRVVAYADPTPIPELTITDSDPQLLRSERPRNRHERRAAAKRQKLRSRTR